MGWTRTKAGWQPCNEWGYVSPDAIALAELPRVQIPVGPNMRIGVPGGSRIKVTTGPPSAESPAPRDDVEARVAAARAALLGGSPGSSDAAIKARTLKPLLEDAARRVKGTSRADDPEAVSSRTEAARAALKLPRREGSR
jgi:hypothetical protein